MTNAERARWHEMVNGISDLCNAVVTDQMMIDEVIAYYEQRLQAIYALACYPEEAGKAAA